MINKIKHNQMLLNFGEKGHFFLSLDDKKLDDYRYGYINTNVIFGASSEAEFKEKMIMPTSDFFEHKSTDVKEDKITVSYGIDTQPVVIEENLSLVEGLNIVRQNTQITNVGDKSVHISRLSSACVTGIGLGGSKYFENDNRFIVHYCYNRWQGEGQWKSATLSQLGIYPGSRHPWEKCNFRLQSIGSWTTREYYPLVIIEDTERNECWFFEKEGSESWYIEISAFEGNNAPFICVSIGGYDEQIGWTHDLQPGEKFSTNSCFYGVIKGGLDEVARTITEYKRNSQTMKADTTVMFNDFMNCNWAMPTREKLIPLIDTAAEVGCEGFCIDAGWSIEGEWDPLDEKFGEGGFKGIIEYIKSKGMRPGVWFEFERTTYKVADEIGYEILMKRNGNIVAHYRPKLDLNNATARKWLFEKIKNVYDMGVRYIKNDHNSDERFGVNYNGESPVDGLIIKNKAYREFIAELNEKFPDLVIESCQAGGANTEHDWLKRFSLQSVTDQENYRLMPSILMGSLLQYEPEKAGMWAYPYPLLSKYMFENVIPEEQMKSFADGRETIFNMVNGMMGYMYLSGKIHLMDELNLNLVKESLATYKTYNKTLSSRYPVYPTGIKGMYDKTMQSLGLIDKDGKDMILAVWALEDKDFTIDLSKYGFKNIERLYPKADFGVSHEYNDGQLKMSFEKENSAVLFVLK